jgi:phosphoribosylanthranilate isomerase
LSDEIGLTLLQFSGDEGPSFCAEAARRTGARVIKAAQVSGPGDVRDLERFHVDFHLLDARASAPDGQQLRGGTGETFDWSLLSARRSQIPLILSGGLRPDNVAEAIERVHPYALDTASGTEDAPGRKDEAKLRAFFDAVSATAARPDTSDASVPADDEGPAASADTHDGGPAIDGSPEDAGVAVEEGTPA